MQHAAVATFVLLFAVGGCDRRNVAQREAEGAQSDQAAAADMAAILAHPWWKRPPVKERVNDLADVIAKAGSQETVFFDEEANIEVRDGQELSLKPEKVGKRYCTVQPAKRTTRSGALSIVRQELDRATRTDARR